MATPESYNGYVLWHYYPSIPAGVIFIVLFAILTALHTWRMVKTKVWFCTPFVVGGVFEVVGYVGRVLAHNRTTELPPYIMQSTLLLLAPILFAASLYMTFGRLVRAFKGDRFSIIPPRWITRIFVFGDCFSFLIQGSGAGLIVKSSNPKMGERIIIGGLILQIVMFGFYIVTGVHFHLRYSRHGPTEQFPDIPWRSTLYMLYTTSAAIMVRNIYRVVEYSMGNDSYLVATEWPTYVFDGVPMVVTMAWFLYRYPSQLRVNKSATDSRIEMTTSEGDESFESRQNMRQKP